MTNHCCLHVDLTLNIPPETWLAHCEAAVAAMNEVPSLLWKLWILDPETGRAGGIYLFRDAESARAYADGPLIEGIRQSGAVRSLELHLLPIVDSLSRRTRGLTG